MADTTQSKPQRMHRCSLCKNVKTDCQVVVSGCEWLRNICIIFYRDDFTIGTKAKRVMMSGTRDCFAERIDRRRCCAMNLTLLSWWPSRSHSVISPRVSMIDKVVMVSKDDALNSFQCCAIILRTISVIFLRCVRVASARYETTRRWIMN